MCVCWCKNTTVHMCTMTTFGSHFQPWTCWAQAFSSIGPLTHWIISPIRFMTLNRIAKLKKHQFQWPFKSLEKKSLQAFPKPLPTRARALAEPPSIALCAGASCTWGHQSEVHLPVFLDCILFPRASSFLQVKLYKSLVCERLDSVEINEALPGLHYAAGLCGSREGESHTADLLTL